MKEETYKIEFTKKEIIELINLCKFSFEKIRPFIPMELIRAERKLQDIITFGCFKHKRMVVMFRTNPKESVTICLECNPKEYAELKSKYKVQEPELF